MTYWEEVREVIKKGIDLASEGIKENLGTMTEKAKTGFSHTADTVAGKTREGVTIVKLRSFLYFKQREYQTALADLGNAVQKAYHKKADIYEDPEVSDNIRRTTDLEKECKEIEKEIASVGTK